MRSGEAGLEIPQRGCESTCVAAARMTGWSTTVSLDDEKSTTRAPSRKEVGSMSDCSAWRSIYRSIRRMCAGQSSFFGGNWQVCLPKGNRSEFGSRLQPYGAPPTTVAPRVAEE